MSNLSIPRDVLMKIFGGLPDDKLIQALSIVSGQGGAAGDFDPMAAMSMGDDDDKIQSWNDRTVDYGGGQGRPSLTDKTWAQQPLNAQQAVPEGGGMGEPDGNPFLQTGGT